MKCKLGDIVEVTMGQSPKSEFYNADGKGTPFLQGNRTFGSKYPTFDTFTTFVTKQGRAGDVIMSVRAPVGDVNVTPVDICLGRGVCSLRMKNGSQEFLYYMMRHYAQALINRESGTVFGSVNKNDVNGLDVEVPSEETQRKIAAILSALDDKIELNRRINANLEQQAAAIFDSWLIRNIESGKTVSLDEVCAKVTDGSHFSPKDDSSSSIPMFSVKDMERYDFDFRSCKHISDADFEKMVANDCVPRINDILVAKDGSYLKEIFICNEARKIAVLSSIAIFRPNLERVIPEILLAFLKSPAILKIVRENFVSGSALPRIVLKDFKKLKFMLPDVEKQSEIAPLLAVFRRQIGNNVMENVRLNILRDALLPRLMSGEIDVSDVSL